MKSATLPSFWDAYDKLDEAMRKQARKAYLLWREPVSSSVAFQMHQSQRRYLGGKNHPRLARGWSVRRRYGDLDLDWQA